MVCYFSIIALMIYILDDSGPWGNKLRSKTICGAEFQLTVMSAILSSATAGALP
jgi:hypothetical protein